MDTGVWCVGSGGWCDEFQNEAESEIDMPREVRESKDTMRPRSSVPKSGEVAEGEGVGVGGGEGGSERSRGTGSGTGGGVVGGTRGAAVGR